MEALPEQTYIKARRKIRLAIILGKFRIKGEYEWQQRELLPTQKKI